MRGCIERADDREEGAAGGEPRDNEHTRGNTLGAAPTLNKSTSARPSVFRSEVRNVPGYCARVTNLVVNAGWTHAAAPPESVTLARTYVSFPLSVYRGVSVRSVASTFPS